MTILLQGNGPKAIRGMAAYGPTELSSRPERSAVEGPVVSLPVLTLHYRLRVFSQALAYFQLTYTE
jgi:hypothetical protein